MNAPGRALRGVVPVLLLTLACSTPMSSRPAPPTERLSATAPELYVLRAAHTGSSPAARDAFEQAERAQADFDRAERSYRDGDYHAAAHAFMTVADEFTARPDGVEAETFSENRAVSYRNAVSAFRMSGEREAAERALRAARVRHASDAAVLDELLAALKRH